MEVKLYEHEGELYVLAKSGGRQAKRTPCGANAASKKWFRPSENSATPSPSLPSPPNLRRRDFQPSGAPLSGTPLPLLDTRSSENCRKNAWSRWIVLFGELVQRLRFFRSLDPLPSDGFLLARPSTKQALVRQLRDYLHQVCQCARPLHSPGPAPASTHLCHPDDPFRRRLPSFDDITRPHFSRHDHALC